MKKILSFLGLALPASLLAQVNLNISNYTFNNNYDDAEPYVAVSPVNPNNMIAAWMKVTVSPVMSIATSYSTDGGSTWSLPLNMPSLHSNFLKADVSIAYNASGTAYICYIDYDPAFDSGWVMVASSASNGQTWSTPVKVTSGLESPDLPIDRPWIAIDRSGGTYNGRIYVVSKSAEAGQLPHHIWMKSSADGGLTWTPRLQLDNPATLGFIPNSMGSIDVGPDGNVYVAYMSYDTAQSPFPRMMLDKSTNGGSSFISSVIAYPVNGSAITDTLYQGSYCLKVNPANGNNLVFIVTDARNGDPDILAVRSVNGGSTWTFTPVRVNDDAQSSGSGQDMCWGGFSSNGTYCAVWRDRRNGGSSSSSNFEVYASVSTDGGATFKPNLRISDQQSPVIPIQKGNDFLGVGLDNNFLVTDWCDKRTANTEIFVNRNPMAQLLSAKDIEANALFTLQLFPNPTASAIHYVIRCEKEAHDADAVVYDMAGKVVASSHFSQLGAGENEFMFSTMDKGKTLLPPGEYVLKVSIGKSTAQRKFTVIKE